MPENRIQLNGNGACSGKKAWLCAGSLLSKLAKQGEVSKRRIIVYPDDTVERI